MNLALKPTLDPLETVLLYLLDANQEISRPANFVIGSAVDEWQFKFMTSDTYYKDYIRPQRPKKCLFIGDFSNAERLYTNDENLLIRPAHELIGDRAEIAMYCDDHDQLIRWQLWKRLPERPKGFIPSMFGDLIYYERHYRCMRVDTNHTDYSINYFAWNPKINRLLPVVKNNQDTEKFTKAAEECTDAFLVHASIIDDSECKYFFHVTIQSSITLVFYVDCDAVKELFKIRDNPLTANDRRRPIVHWVCEHLRKKPVNKGYTEIPEHLRGVTEFDFEGLQIKINSIHDKRG